MPAFMILLVYWVQRGGSEQRRGDQAGPFELTGAMFRDHDPGMITEIYAGQDTGNAP